MTETRYTITCDRCGAKWDGMKPEHASGVVNRHGLVCKGLTGAERYFAGRMTDPEYAAAYAAVPSQESDV